MKKKTIALLVTIFLITGAIIAGTIAWLSDKTAPVVNTFTAGDINIELDEDTEGPYKMVPGYTIKKDPVVTVKGDSEKCYLFVELDESANFGSFMTYAVADGWTALSGTGIPANLYYRVVDASTTDQVFVVLKDNEVAVKEDVTKAMLDALTESTQPTLTVTAYASQFYKDNSTDFTPAEAWTNVSP